MIRNITEDLIAIDASSLSREELMKVLDERDECKIVCFNHSDQALEFSKSIIDKTYKWSSKTSLWFINYVSFNEFVDHKIKEYE